MRVAYRGFQNGFHTVEWLPTEGETFPIMRLLYAGAESQLEIEPYKRTMTTAEAEAFHSAYRAMMEGLEQLRNAEITLFDLGQPINVADLCRELVKIHNNAEYDERGGA